MPLDASGVKSESDIQGRQRPEEGIYHAIVEHIDASQEKHDAVIADVKVLAGNVDNQAGRSLRHMMFLNKEDGGYTEQHLRFALATGVIKPGQKKEPDWSEAIGQQIVIGVEKRDGKDGKTYTQVSNFGLDIWSVDNPDKPEIPMDAEALKLRGTNPAGGRSNGQAAKKADDDWDI